MFYTGIGARNTPPEILDNMRIIAANLGRKGYTLRSGAAPGAGSAFEKGCLSVGGKMEIFLPWPKFEGRYGQGYIVANNPEAEKIAESFHPAWHKCSKGVKKLHTRNIYQILGADLNTPTGVVICWTPYGKVQGGTGQAIKIAKAYNIKVKNLFK